MLRVWQKLFELKITFLLNVSQNEASPCSHVNGLFVGRGHSETHGGHHGLVPCGVDDLPLGSVRVVGQHALVLFIDGNLKEL